MRREIGSEFWMSSHHTGQAPSKSRATILAGKNHYLLSGRTAIDFIVKDYKAKEKLEKVMLPSYCCSSMIIPFLKNDVSVSFYDVIPDEQGHLSFRIDPEAEYDGILVMNYFGFAHPATEKLLDDSAAKSKLVIKDITHTLLSEREPDLRADYTFGSIRKWFYMPDGAILQKKGDFNLELPRTENREYVYNRLLALHLKTAYIHDGQVNKSRIFNYYKVCDDILAEKFSGFAMSKISRQVLRRTDLDRIIHDRRHNARVLIEKLGDLEQVELIFREVAPHDVPLFVPILVKNGLRDELKKYLIQHNIFCPTHWNLSPLHEISEQCKSVYQQELSLICDHRYNADDMRQIANLIHKFFTQNTF